MKSCDVVNNPDDLVKSCKKTHTSIIYDEGSYQKLLSKTNYELVEIIRKLNKRLENGK